MLSKIRHVVQNVLGNYLTTGLTAKFTAGKALKDVPRDKVIIASKWGPMTDGKGKFWMDSSPEYCMKSLEDSLKRMGTDYVDLYIMRSVDGKTPIEESVKAMAVSHKHLPLGSV